MKACIMCGTEFYGSVLKKFCSDKCKKQHWKINNKEKYKETTRIYNAKVTERKRKERGIIIKVCEYCNKSFKPLPVHPYQKYCSWKCRNKMFVKNNPEKVKEYRKTDRIRHKEYINKRDMEYHDKIRYGGNRKKCLVRDGHKCMTCHKTLEELGERGLVIHHIDKTGQSENPNQELNNLITLCRSCHRKIHTK